jgi:hypothetical protein
MALTANREVSRYVDQEIRSFPVKSGVHVFKGALVGLIGGYVRPLTGGDWFVGVAYEEADNSGGTDGEVMVRISTSGDFEHALSGADRAYNRFAVYASDDNTLTYTRVGNSFVGYQMDVTSANQIVLRAQTTPTPLSGGAMLSPITSAGLIHPVMNKVAAAEMTISSSEMGGVVAISGTTAANVNLPSASLVGAGMWATFIKTGASGVLTLDADGSETIDGALTNTEMDAAHDSVTIMSDGINWHIIAKKIS